MLVNSNQEEMFEMMRIYIERVCFIIILFKITFKTFKNCLIFLKRMGDLIIILLIQKTIFTKKDMLILKIKFKYISFLLRK